MPYNRNMILPYLYYTYLPVYFDEIISLLIPRLINVTLVTDF